MRDARFAWCVPVTKGESAFRALANLRLIANTADVEYVDLQNAAGVYVKQAQQIGRTTRTILYWRRNPGVSTPELQ